MKDKKIYEFSSEKNCQLINERGISFEEIISALENDKLLDVVEHHDKEKYPNQDIYVLDIDNYVYLVPFVKKNSQTVFLKTIFPSRKFNKQYFSNKVIKNDKKT